MLSFEVNKDVYVGSYGVNGEDVVGAADERLFLIDVDDDVAATGRRPSSSSSCAGGTDSSCEHHL